MSADVAARLRMLAQDHHDGRLDLAAYRALRAPLLDSLVLNTALVASAMEITQPRAAVRATIEDATTRPGKPNASGAAATSGATASSGSWPVAAPGAQNDSAPAGVQNVGATGGAPSGGASAGAWSGGALAGARNGDASGAWIGSDSPGGQNGGTGAGPHVGSGASSAQNGGTARDARADSGASKRPSLGIVAIGVVLVAVAAIAFWMWRGSSPGGADAGPVQAGAADHVHDLIAPFIDRGDWSDGRLTSLNASLLELGGAQIATVTRETWFQRFVDELRRRLKEQQALAATPLTVDTSPLAALAVTVGIDLNSPDAAIHIATLPPPPTAAEPSTAARAAEKRAKSAARHAGDGIEASTGGHHGALGTHSAGSAGADAAAGADGDLGAGGAGASDTSANGTGGARGGAGTSSDTSANRPRGGGSTTAMGSVPGSSIRSGIADGGENACRAELIGSRRPLCHDTLPAGNEAPLLALVPAGGFAMGGTLAAEERPVHRVTIREPFAISVYEVSQGEFKQFCEQTNRTCAQQPWSGDDYPVVNVSWDDAHAYTEWLTSVTHHRYSLPTEAQWEYAARAGQTGLFPGGDALSPTDAHYSMVAKQTTAARRAEKYKANAFRLVHVVGNVREWVEDGWSPNFSSAPADGSAVKVAQASTRVARGGSYTDGAARLRLSMREALPAGTRDTTTGFRIVRELP